MNLFFSSLTTLLVIGSSVNVLMQTFESKAEITDLIRNCERNLTLFEGVYDYSFTQKRTIRSFNKRGQMIKEDVVVSEAFPTQNRQNLVLVKVSENGKPLSKQRIADERKRAARRIEESEKRKEPEKEKDPDESGYYKLGFKDFLRSGDFKSPRRVRFGDRDAIVLDYSPRADFRASTRSEKILLNLVGTVWIDTESKQIMRVEAYPRDKGYRASSKPMGLIHPDAAFVFEQRPTREGVWIFTLMHYDTIVNSKLFNDAALNFTFEFSNFRRYETNVESYDVNR